MAVTDFEIQEASFHRNGISGNGFYAIRFLWQPEGASAPENFLATLFDEPGSCAVLSLDRIATMGVGFAHGNSWRGDHFEDELRKRVLGGGTTSGIRDTITRTRGKTIPFGV